MSINIRIFKYNDPTILFVLVFVIFLEYKYIRIFIHKTRVLLKDFHCHWEMGCAHSSGTGVDERLIGEKIQANSLLLITLTGVSNISIGQRLLFITGNWKQAGQSHYIFVCTLKETFKTWIRSRGDDVVSGEVAGKYFGLRRSPRSSTS